MDTFDGMKQLPDASVDMVLTDPPYGTTCNKWDTVVDMDAFWKEIKRVAKKNSAILIFTQMPFTATVVMSNPKMFRYEWICEKADPTGFLNARRMPMKCHENVLVFYGKLPVYHPIMEHGKPYRCSCSPVLSTNCSLHLPKVALDFCPPDGRKIGALSVSRHQSSGH